MSSSVTASARPKPECIRLRGVRQNNLKGFDLDVPLGRYIVVTGLSGAGKSSLVFDTLHAEGQRRYVETFSAYTRQFLDLLDKPKVDSIENIRPSIAIEQTNTVFRMANKAQEEAQLKATQGPRQERLRALWTAVLPIINARIELYRNVQPTKDAWLSAGSGVRAVPYSFGVNAQSASVLLNISKANRAANKFLYDYLFARKDAIEAAFGQPLIWDVVEDRLSMKIIHTQSNLSYNDDAQWPSLTAFLAGQMERLEQALRQPLAAANAALQQSALTGAGAEAEDESDAIITSDDE